MFLKFTAPLLLFSSTALHNANYASYENTSDQERCVFPIPHVNFPFESISKLPPVSFFVKGFILLICLFLFSASTCKEIFERNV